MPIIKTDAVVLRSLKYGDTSKIITLYSKDLGKISCIVKGARNTKSKYCGVLEPMNYINCTIYFKDSRDLQVLSSAEYKKAFSKIQEDFDKITSAYRIIEVLNKSTHGNDNNESVFELIFKTLENLNNADSNYQNYVLYFLIRLTEALGISPNFSTLDNFDFIGSDFVKESTGVPYDSKFTLNPEQYSILRCIYDCAHNELNKHSVDEKLISNLINMYDRYLGAHIDNYSYLKAKKVINEIKLNS